MLRKYSILAAGFLALVLGGLGGMVFFAPEEGQFAQCRETSVAGGSGAIGGPFTLTDHTGQQVTEADFADRPVLLYFGYTFCPDVCPYDLARNAEAVYALTERGYDVTPVFISVDHGRDTLEALSEFVSFLHPDMIGLTGTEQQIRDAARAYRAYYAVQETDDEFYLIDHSTFTYLNLPGHGFVELFRREGSDARRDGRSCCLLH